MTPSQPTKEFEAAVHEALQLWRQESEPAGPLAHLALVRQRAGRLRFLAPELERLVDCGLKLFRGLRWRHGRSSTLRNR